METRRTTEVRTADPRLPGQGGVAPIGRQPSFTLKFKVTESTNGVGTPFSTSGEYFHCFTASTAA
jgi:hypothetical protein